MVDFKQHSLEVGVGGVVFDGGGGFVVGLEGELLGCVEGWSVDSLLSEVADVYSVLIFCVNVG